MLKTLFSIFLFLFPVKALSLNINDDVNFYGSFFHINTEPNILFLLDEIKIGDNFELRRALRSNDIDLIVLASPGGSVFEALAIAGTIHDKGISTHIPKIDDLSGCFSACAFLFFAGKNRVADGLLGVHQAGYYDEERDGQVRQTGELQNETQYAVSEIIGFLNEFDTPAWVYERMFRSREMYVFTDDEKKELQIGLIADESIDRALSTLLEFLSEFNDLIQSNEIGVKVTELDTFSTKLSDRQFVYDLQKRLNILGCSAGIEDGIFGKRTLEALRSFAEANGLRFSNVEDLNEEFLLVLLSDDPKQCSRLVPQTPPKVSTPSPSNSRLASSWFFNFTCGFFGKRIFGDANLSFIGMDGDKAKYSVEFIDNNNRTYLGVITDDGRRMEFVLNERNGPASFSGTATSASGGGSAFGSTTNDCGFDGRPK